MAKVQQRCGAVTGEEGAARVSPNPQARRVALRVGRRVDARRETQRAVPRVAQRAQQTGDVAPRRLRLGAALRQRPPGSPLKSMITASSPGDQHLAEVKVAVAARHRHPARAAAAALALANAARQAPRAALTPAPAVRAVGRASALAAALASSPPRRRRRRTRRAVRHRRSAAGRSRDCREVAPARGAVRRCWPMRVKNAAARAGGRALDHRRPARRLGERVAPRVAVVNDVVLPGL